MADFKIRPISPSRYNESQRFHTYPLSAGQDFQKGAPVVLEAGGTVAETGTDPASILGFATADKSGYDWQTDSFGHVTPRVPVAESTQEFRGTLTGTHVAATDIGAEFGLVEDGTTGYWVVDRTETTAARVTIIGVEDEAVDGDTNVPVRFIVLSANRQVV